MATRKTIIVSRASLCVGVMVCLALTAWSHPGIDVQIRDITRRIEQDPKDANLFLRRGELHRIHRDWELAEADYLRAAKLDPEMAAVDLCLGKLRLESDEPAEAREALDRFVARRPEHAEGRALRGRALFRSGRPLAAADEFTRAVALAGERPKPDYYIERARALEAAGAKHLDRAVRGLDEGLQQLGQPVTLQLLAIELDLRRGNHDGALSRLERIAAASARQESWLLRRGEILESAGKPDEARRAYHAALEAIQGLPVSRRQTKAVKRIEDEARHAVERLDAHR